MRVDFGQLCGSTCEVVLESNKLARAVLVGSSTAEGRLGDTLPVFVFRSEDHVVPVCSRWKRGGTTKPDNRDGGLAKLQREGIVGEPCATTNGKECAGCQRTFAVYVGNQESLVAKVVEQVIGPVPTIAKGNMPSPINLSWVPKAPKLGLEELMPFDFAEEGGGGGGGIGGGGIGRLFTHFLHTKAAYTCGLADMGTGGGHAATAGAGGLSSNAGGNTVGLPSGTGGDAGGVGGGESKEGGALPDAKGRRRL